MSSSADGDPVTHSPPTKKLRVEQCDSALPRCTPCQTSNSECQQADVRRQTSYPRGYVEDLETRCRVAERKLLRSMFQLRSVFKLSVPLSSELLAKVLPGVSPQDFQSLLDSTTTITPARQQQTLGDQNNDSKIDESDAPSVSRVPSMSTARNLSHLMNDDAMTSPASVHRQSFSLDQHPGRNTQGSVLIDPSLLAASALAESSADFSSSPQPLIAQLCSMSSDDAADQIFRLSATEYATIARQLGYSLAGEETPALSDNPAMTESAKSSTPGTNFWAEVLEMEDDTRQEEEKTAKENSWTFPPRDREMARRVIDKFFHGINHFRPIINEEEFKREYGRLSRGTVTDSEEFQPEFIACAHMVLALGTTIMDLEAQQTKSALTEVPVRGPPIPFAPDWTHSGGQQEQALATTIHSAAAMSDRPVPANNFQFPLGHSTLFDKNDIEENIDGIGKDDYTWPAATYFFRQGMRVVRKGTDTSMQDLQKMIMVFLWYSYRVPISALWR